MVDLIDILGIILVDEEEGYEEEVDEGDLLIPKN